MDKQYRQIISHAQRWPRRWLVLGCTALATQVRSRQHTPRKCLTGQLTLLLPTKHSQKACSSAQCVQPIAEAVEVCLPLCCTL